MKTRYKILIVIAIFTVFFFIRMPLATTCHVLSEDKDNCKILMKIVYETSPTIRTGDGIASWTGTADGMEQPTTPFYVEDNVNVIVLYFVLPISIIFGIYFKDKRK